MNYIPYILVVIVGVSLLLGQAEVALSATALTMIAGLILSRKAQEITRARCYCIFGGLITLFFLAGLCKWGGPFQNVPLLAIPCFIMILCDTPMRKSFFGIVREWHAPLEGGNTPETMMTGLFWWCLLIVFYLILAFLLGGVMVLWLFFKSLLELYQHATPVKLNIKRSKIPGTPMENPKDAPFAGLPPASQNDSDWL